MGKKVIKLTETQLKNIVKNISEEITQDGDIDEGILDRIKEPFSKIYHGIRGVKGGYGYDYFANLVELRNMLKDLQKFDEPNKKLFIRLLKLRTKVMGSTMRPDLQQNLVTNIDAVINKFTEYTNVLDRLIVGANIRLKKPSQQQNPSPTPTPTQQQGNP